jgi:hypothetical protein
MADTPSLTPWHKILEDPFGALRKRTLSAPFPGESCYLAHQPNLSSWKGTIFAYLLKSSGINKWTEKKKTQIEKIGNLTAGLIFPLITDLRFPPCNSSD